MRNIGMGLCCVIAITALGCSDTPSARWAGDPESLVPQLCGDAPKGKSPISPEVAKLRTRGLEALRAGEHVRARELFDEALEMAPSNVSLVGLYAAAEDGVQASLKDASELLDKERPVKMKPAEKAADDKRPSDKSARVALIELGEVRVEGKADARALGMQSVNSRVPPTLRRVYTLRSALADHDRGVMIYQRNNKHLVVQLAPAGVSQRAQIADFSDYADDGDSSQHVQLLAATFAGDAVYAAIEVKGEHMLVAHDRRDGSPLWRVKEGRSSHSLTAFGKYLIVAGSSPSSGSQLWLLDRKTGRTLASHLSAHHNPSLSQRDGVILARSGELAQVFTLDRRLPKPTPDASLSSYLAKVRKGGPAKPTRDPFAFPRDAAVDIAEPHRCGISHALVELDEGRFDDAAARLTLMERLYPQHPVVVALTATSRLLQRRVGVAGVNLAQAHPRALERLPAQRYGGPTSPQTIDTTLVEKGAQPSEALAEWVARHDVERFTLRPDELPETIPQDYGRHPVSEWVRDGSSDVIVYGNRYIIDVRDGQVAHAFDGRTLFVGDGDDAPLPGRGVIRLALIRGDTLFVSFSDLSAYGGVAAIDVEHGSTRWYSSVRLYGAVQLAVAGEHVVIGSNRQLYVLRRSDGATVTQTSLRDSLAGMVFRGQRLLVNLSSGSHEYAIESRGG